VLAPDNNRPAWFRSIYFQPGRCILDLLGDLVELTEALGIVDISVTGYSSDGMLLFMHQENILLQLTLE
jgi:hypothetical protein